MDKSYFKKICNSFNEFHKQILASEGSNVYYKTRVIVVILQTRPQCAV